MREHHPMRYNRLTEVLKTVSSVKLSTAFLLKSYFLKRPLASFQRPSWSADPWTHGLLAQSPDSSGRNYCLKLFKDNVILIICFQHICYGLCCICIRKSIRYMHVVPRCCLVGSSYFDQSWLWRIHPKETFYKMVHITWTISYGPYHMVHIIWSISHGPFHMVHFIWTF